ncbi:MAG TPA: T9SS type A sorting domain-containing protein, partial [Candidatus Cloacimonadota bacterium]|nr:T9SS type A sorting domain-containing protein [Candidatus Cloacimonadota bacterium]
KIYMEGNVNWDMNDPFLAKFGVEAPLDVVITIEGISHPPKYWAYNALQDGYRELVPMIPSAQAVFWTANTDPSIHTIGVKNSGAQHQTIAASFLLSEVLNPDPAKDDSFQDLIAEIMYELDILDDPNANDDLQTPAALMSISAWPNPARNMINIALENHKGGPARICLYNVRGQKVQDILLSDKNGFSSIWNAKDLQGRDCPAGVYIIKSGDVSRKITLLP